MLYFLKRRPDFLILGAQKAGTSSLEFFLSQHPQIKCARTKEVGFFSRDQLFQSGPGWYARQFPRRNWPGTLLFEATPEYLYYPFAAERIREFDPRMKCLILLRNPVNRAFSAWNMYRQFHSDPQIKAQTIREYLEGTKPEVLRPLLELLDRPQFP
ncbi:MAG TPA: sulfotransferase domain-containing protein, partial [Bacillota bacterium]|nr:sulfotransferase domain-containing protein [Bacillota bacterium]